MHWMRLNINFVLIHMKKRIIVYISMWFVMWLRKCMEWSDNVQYLYNFRPTTNAIMGLTFANYVLQPLFPTCLVPDVPKRLIAALTICKYCWYWLVDVQTDVNSDISQGILTFINGYDVRFTTKMQNVFMFTKISALALIIMAGVVWMAKGKRWWDNNRRVCFIHIIL